MNSRVIPLGALTLFLLLTVSLGSCRKPFSEDIEQEVRSSLELAEKMVAL